MIVEDKLKWKIRKTIKHFIELDKKLRQLNKEDNELKI